MRKNNAFVAKIVTTRLTEIFMAIFAPDERLPSSATLLKALSILTHSVIQHVCSSKKKLQEAFKSWSSFSLVSFGKGQEIK